MKIQEQEYGRVLAEAREPLAPEFIQCAVEWASQSRYTRANSVFMVSSYARILSD